LVNKQVHTERTEESQVKKTIDSMNPANNASLGQVSDVPNANWRNEVSVNDRTRFVSQL
jgi:hypothetical protein